MNEKARAVCYSPQDYAGVGRRLFAVAIDGGVLFAVLIATLIGVGFPAAVPPANVRLYAVAYMVFVAVYLAVLGRSRVGTLGCLLASVRVVNLHGDRPSLPCMLYRTLFAFLGPFPAVLDILWLGGDPNRQTIVDKLAETYVVRRGASPSGAGHPHHVMVMLGSWSFLVTEVNRDAT